MNLVKVLETIGANNSLNEFENPEEMLLELEIDKSILSDIKIEKIELVCMVFPEQDEPDEDSEEPDEDSEERSKLGSR